MGGGKAKRLLVLLLLWRLLGEGQRGRGDDGSAAVVVLVDGRRMRL
jgi:hypothetical protein